MSEKVELKRHIEFSNFILNNKLLIVIILKGNIRFVFNRLMGEVYQSFKRQLKGFESLEAIRTDGVWKLYYHKSPKCNSSS